MHALQCVYGVPVFFLNDIVYSITTNYNAVIIAIIIWCCCCCCCWLLWFCFLVCWLFRFISSSQLQSTVSATFSAKYYFDPVYWILFLFYFLVILLCFSHIKTDHFNTFVYAQSIYKYYSRISFEMRDEKKTFCLPFIAFNFHVRSFECC